MRYLIQIVSSVSNRPADCFMEKTVRSRCFRGKNEPKNQRAGIL